MRMLDMIRGEKCRDYERKKDTSDTESVGKQIDRADTTSYLGIISTYPLLPSRQQSAASRGGMVFLRRPSR